MLCLPSSRQCDRKDARESVLGTCIRGVFKTKYLVVLVTWLLRVRQHDISR